LRKKEERCAHRISLNWIEVKRERRKKLRKTLPIVPASNGEGDTGKRVLRRERWESLILLLSLDRKGREKIVSSPGYSV